MLFAAGATTAVAEAIPAGDATRVSGSRSAAAPSPFVPYYSRQEGSLQPELAGSALWLMLSKVAKSMQGLESRGRRSAREQLQYVQLESVPGALMLSNIGGGGFFFKKGCAAVEDSNHFSLHCTCSSCPWT